MKKILLFTSILFFTLFAGNLKSQTIDSVSVTSPILCYGDFANVTVHITQSSPATPLNYILKYSVNGGNSYFQIGQAPLPPATTTGTSQPFLNLVAGMYRIELKNASGTVLDTYDFSIYQPSPFSATTTPVTQLLCNGDCDASEKITMQGGTPPYTINFNGVNTLGITSIDTTYGNLCANTYTPVITDANGCATSAVISFTVADPPLLVPNGNISSNFNGQNISCNGASDGEITAVASGGTAPYTYSIDGINFSSNNVFTGLNAGSYTITYKDANGCDTTEVFTLTNPPNLSGALSISQQVSCNGVNDGSIQFIVDNINVGTPTYTYSIDGGTTFQSSNTFTGLAGGQTHSIMVQDANGCQASASIFLAAPSAIIFSTSSSNFNGFGVSCNSATDGQIIIFSPSGGTPNYDYSIDGGTSYSSTMIHNGLGAGAYVVTVRDANNCTNDTTINITEPGPFSITAASTTNYNGFDVSCPSACDGTVDVTELNGVGTITYNMTSFLPQTSTSWANVCGGNSFGMYTIDATDANGCTASTTITLNEPLPWVYSVDSIRETCNLGNGQASISVTQGGVAPYGFLWDDASAQITSAATNLVTGVYTVTVTDMNGCTLTEDVNVGEADITLDFDSVPPCNGGNDGSATVSPDGTPPYQISWFNGATTNTVSGLAPGYYSVTVVDGTGCIVTDSVEVPASAIVDVTLDVTNSTLDVTCFGYPSSGVTVNATGGTGANTYLYHIPNTFPIPQASNTFSGLYAGIYPIYATDANGCSDSVMVTITQPDALMFTTSSVDVSCFAGSDGIASIDTIYGGTAPYTYLWNTGAITPTISNLAAGTYYAQVSDANGCASIPQTDTVVVGEPSALQSSINIVSHSNCAGSQALATGEMDLTITGGTPGYTYAWSNGGNTTNINLLLSGTYSVVATDANGCSISDTAEILPGSNPDLAVQIQDVSCFGANDGMMFVSAISGTPPYQFTDDGGSNFVPSGTPFGPSGQAGYFITVVDSLGCTDSDSVYVNEPDLLQINSIGITNVSCYDSANGELATIFSGGTAPFTYLWSDGQTTQTATNLVPGSYSVTVTDTNGCVDNSASVNITQPDSLYISSLTSTAVLCNGGNSGTTSITAMGGTPNYSYLWSSGSTSDTALNLISGSYAVTISDANGCSRNSNILVSEPSALSVVYIKDSVTCVGGSDGWATALVSGGVSPYSYLWDNASIINTANNLSAGYHTITITDTNGCVLVDSVEIVEPASSITIDSLIVTDITCHDADNATITVLATGGQLPYLYSKNNGQNSQSNIGFTNLGPDTYIMRVLDSRGCIDRDTIEIVNPDSLYIDTTIFSHVQCYGMNNASIQAINAFGGTAPYEYSVNLGAHHTNMAYFNGYGPGTYTVQVFDVNNCAAQDIIIINEPSELDVTITTSEWNSYQVRCNGDASGFANISVTGGVAPYIKTVLDASLDTVVSSVSSYINNLSAGVYTFVIMDAQGCTYTEVITYNEPAPIVHNFIATHVSCEGWSNGSLTDVVSGGVGSPTSYIYAWNTGDSTYSLTSIPTGVYTMTVKDNNNCISVDSYTINDNNALNVTATATVVSCHDYCDGIISANVTGGMPNINSSGNPVYTYQWDDVLSQTTANAIGLCVDNTTNQTVYTCVVTDGQGCNDTVTYTLTQPEELQVSASIIKEVSCNLDSDGILTATTTGGNGGITYLWNDWTAWNAAPVNNSLPAGSYVVVAKDNKGCMDTTEIYLAEPSILSIDVTETDISCYGFDDGTITADVTGGTVIGIQEYVYDWSNGFSEQTQISTASGLAPGIYTVTATDDNGCTITSETIYITEPANPLSMTVDSTDETCTIDDGTATAFVLGGTQSYTYNWSNGGTTQSISNLEPGLYTVDVTDANGCTISGETTVIGVRNIFMPGNLSSIDSTICLGASVSLPIEVRPTLIYTWINNNDTIYRANSGNYMDITVTPTEPVNVYTLSILDPSCANPYEVFVTINVNDVSPNPSTNPLPENGPYSTIVKGEQITLFSNHNTCDIYSWSWTVGDSTYTRNNQSIDESPENSGWYHLAVDSAGCLGFDSVYVVVGVKPYDAITPNGDGFNDVWNVLDIASYPNAIVQIFNRWGVIVHETAGGQDYQAWDGTLDGKELPVGTYYYIIDLKTDDEPQTGPITIIR